MPLGPVEPLAPVAADEAVAPDEAVAALEAVAPAEPVASVAPGAPNPLLCQAPPHQSGLVIVLCTRGEREGVVVVCVRGVVPRGRGERRETNGEQVETLSGRRNSADSFSLSLSPHPGAFSPPSTALLNHRCAPERAAAHTGITTWGGLRGGVEPPAREAGAASGRAAAGRGARTHHRPRLALISTSGAPARLPRPARRLSYPSQHPILTSSSSSLPPSLKADTKASLHPPE